MFIIQHSKIFISLAIISILASFYLIISFGLNPSIDFSGGTIYEVRFDSDRPLIEEIDSQIARIAPGSVVQTSDEKGLIIKAAEITDEQKKSIDVVLAGDSGRTYEELRYKQLGPAISNELQNKAVFAIVFVVLVIVLFIAYTFRHVSKPVSSFKYGLVAIAALIHDTIIPIGVFAVLGSFFIDYQIDVLFITAILATLGYSVNDTIVVFDRVRENLKNAHEQKKPYIKKHFREIVGRSLEQTFKRSLYTSITTLGALSFLFFVGGDATKPFALVLGIGVIAGTYSSLFFASPLLSLLESIQKDKAEEPQQEEQEGDDNLPDDIKRFLSKQK